MTQVPKHRRGHQLPALALTEFRTQMRYSNNNSTVLTHSSDPTESLMAASASDTDSNTWIPPCVLLKALAYLTFFRSSCKFLFNQCVTDLYKRT
jgi:hypothetical protein